MVLSRITAPAVEPVTLVDAKRQIGLSPVEDTDQVKERETALLLRRHIRTAREEIENRTRRALITQTWQLRLDHFPRTGERYAHPTRKDVIRLPKPPFQQLISFTYVDMGGNLQNIVPPLIPAGGAQPGSDVATNYTDPPWGMQLDPGSETQPAHLIAPWPLFWPPTLPVQSAVQLTFTGGYGDTGDCVPAQLTQAILALVHSYYDPGAFKDIEATVTGLIRPWLNRIA